VDCGSLSINYSLEKLEQYIVSQNFQGYDPYDILNSLILGRIIKGSHKYVQIFATQFNRLCPLNKRNILRVKKDFNSKAMALFTSGYLTLYKKNKQKEYLDKAIFCLNWLEQNNCENFDNEYGLGFTFNIMMKTYSLNKGKSSVIISIYAGNAFIDAYEILGDEKYLKWAIAVGNFLINQVPIVRINNNSLWFSYLVSGLFECYNVTSHAAALLARIYFHTKDSLMLKYSSHAMNYIIKKQRNDGSWKYAENINWTDNYHTGFVLESLAKYMKMTDDHRYANQLEKGIQHYKKYMFLATGQPILYHPKYRPNLLRRMQARTDIRDCAQGIIVFKILNSAESDLFASKIASWTIKEMQSQHGYFFYQANHFFKIKIPYIRWQAWMLLALSYLI